MNHQAMTVTDAELDAVFSGPCAPSIKRSAWVNRVAAGAASDLADKALCELASEEDPGGPLASINGLLEGLSLRYAEDSATLAVVAAIQHFHLLNLLDDHAAELRDALMGRR